MNKFLNSSEENFKFLTSRFHEVKVFEHIIGYNIID